MRHLLSLILLTTTLFAASPENTSLQADKGNGGDGVESDYASLAELLDETAEKIFDFFKKYPQVHENFAPLNVNKLLSVESKVSFEIVDYRPEDHEGTKRDCVNYDNYLIRCYDQAVLSWQDRPATLFVMTLHELLGIKDLEVTSIYYDDFRNGYRYSGKVRGYVTRTSEYDLTLNGNDSFEAACTYSVDRHSSLDHNFSSRSSRSRVLRLISDQLQELGYQEVSNGGDVVLYYDVDSNLHEGSEQFFIATMLHLGVQGENNLVLRDRKRLYFPPNISKNAKMRTLKRSFKRVLTNFPTCEEALKSEGGTNE